MTSRHGRRRRGTRVVPTALTTVLAAAASAMLCVGMGVAAAEEAPPVAESGQVRAEDGAARALPASARRSISERGPIGQAGRWFTDGDGRVVLTQGVNMVYKHAPYTPAAAGFDGEDAQWLADHGFDSVRLGVMWKAVEPQPGVYDEAYLDAIAATVEELTSRGILVLLDGHQDMYHEKFQGEFAPDWAVIDDGLPSMLQVGFPANQALNVGLLRAYDNFLANRKGPGGVGLHERYAAMWGHVAARFADTPGIMGYDILNEPWPGSAYLQCYLSGGDCGAGRVNLDRLHSTVARAIHAADPDGIVHYEPLSMWNQGFNTRPARPAPEIEALPTALSWHVYCTSNALFNTYVGCELPDGQVFRNAEMVAQANGSATLLSEFGATDDPATLAGVIGAARRAMVGWQYWSYCGCDDPTTQNLREQGIVADPQAPGPVRTEEVNAEKLRILSAPHARAVAGTPRVTEWDAGQRRYTVAWSTQWADGSGAVEAGVASEIAVPRLHYPDGYVVEVDGGRVVSEPGAERVFVVGDAGSSEVRVQIRPV